MNDDDAIANIRGKIEKEKQMIQAATQMRAGSDNEMVRARLDSQLRDSESYLRFFEENLRNLQMKKLNHGVGSIDLGGAPPPPPKDPNDPYGGRGDRMSAGHHFNAPPPGQPGYTKGKPNFTKLDLIKYDTPYLGPRIQLMLSQLQFKLNVEEQYLTGVEKMVQLYGLEGDRKSKADAAARLVESKQKKFLLKQALKRYEELHIDVEATEENDGKSNEQTARARTRAAAASIMTAVANKYTR